jgi:hypothetical protein
LNNDIRNTIYDFTHSGDVIGKIEGFEEQVLLDSSGTAIQKTVVNEDGTTSLVPVTAPVALIRLQSGAIVRRRREPWMFVSAKYHERKSVQGVQNIPF